MAEVGEYVVIEHMGFAGRSVKRIQAVTDGMITLVDPDAWVQKLTPEQRSVLESSPDVVSRFETHVNGLAKEVGYEAWFEKLGPMHYTEPQRRIQ